MLAVFAGLIVACASPSAEAQRARFEDFFGSNSGLSAPPRNIQIPGGTSGSIIRTPGQLGPPAGILPGQLNGGIINGGIINGGILPPGGFNGGGIVNGGIIPGGVIPGGIVNGGIIPGGVIPGGIVNGGVFPRPAIGTGVAPPTFDPRTPNRAFPIFPRGQTQIPPIQINPGNQNFSPLNRGFNPNGGAQFQQPNIRAPQINQPQINFPALPRFNPGQAQYNYGNPQIPNRWPYEGTGTNWLPSVDWTWPQQAWTTFRTKFLPRVLERPRVRQTYLYGNNGNELNINDIEIATTATLPNFLGGVEPLRISPGFIFNFWDGPDSEVFPDFDLPSRAYSPYLSFDHITDTRNNFGLEGNLTIGYYSDFNNTSSDALRLTSKILAWRRVNPYTVAKLGVEYLDRVNVKLLPAVGLYMTPNPDMKLDLYFPKTKLSHRIPNIGNLEAWAYLGAEYGGGSWAIERRDGTNDQADINDVRAYLGTEWVGPRRVTGFFEFGYAFNREIVYRSNALNKLELQDTLLIRSGIAF